MICTYLILNKMEVDSNVLHMRMEDWAGTNISSTHIVTINGRSWGDRHLQFLKKIHCLVNFSYSRANNSIFYFGGRASDNAIFSFWSSRR